jgi:pyridoxamine 5'-phosphate oxidase
VSEAYFQSRPKGSQIGAWASPQSRTIPGRAFLDARVESLEKQYAGEEVLPLPENWGGYFVRPVMIEFWQGQTNRLHDRLRYSRLPEGDWKLERLAP